MGLKDTLYSVDNVLYTLYTLFSGNGISDEHYDQAVCEITNKIKGTKEEVENAACKTAESLCTLLANELTSVMRCLNNKIKPVAQWFGRRDDYFLKNVNPKVEVHIERLSKKFEPYIKATKTWYIPL